MYTIQMLRREPLDGRSTIVFRLDPKPDYRARTLEGKILTKFRGQAWVSEDDYELAKLDVEAADNASLGLGLIARLDKGSRGVFERQKIDGESWLPSRTYFIGSGRLLLVKRIALDQLSEYSDYKKF